MDKTSFSPKKVELKNLIDHWNFGSILLFMFLKILFLLYKIFNIQKDGWRKTTSVFHRTEQSKYIGGIFNISLAGQYGDHIDTQNIVIDKLYEVFQNSPESHFALKWSGISVKRVYIEYADFLVVKLDTDGKIDNLKFIPDKKYLIGQEIVTNQILEIQRILKDSFNSTLILPDHRRPILLRRKAMKKIKKLTTNRSHRSILNLFDRMIRSCWIHFDFSWSDTEREFRPAFFDHFKHAGYGLFNIECRCSVAPCKSMRWGFIYRRISI